MPLPLLFQAAALQQQQQAYAAQLSQLAMLSQQSGAQSGFSDSADTLVGVSVLAYYGEC